MEDLMPWEKAYEERKADRKLNKENVLILVFALVLVLVPVLLVFGT
ncbi:MAG: hypothetical protein KF690_10205 [Bacteroidetes bacterium]|nr:hypothetical protein [Bacteroidota bacterium]